MHHRLSVISELTLMKIKVTMFYISTGHLSILSDTLKSLSKSEVNHGLGFVFGQTQLLVHALHNVAPRITNLTMFSTISLHISLLILEF